MAFLPKLSLGTLREFFSRTSQPSPSIEPPSEPLETRRFSGPEDVVYPGTKASFHEHIRFLLACKRYIATHPVPPDRLKSLNQYSHAGRPLIGDDRTAPAITNCSYDYFGRKLISIGFPLFIEQARFIKDDNLNPAFNNGTLWDSFSRLLTEHIGDLGDDNLKFGYSLPTYHSYIELPVEKDVFDKAQTVIDFYTRTNITDPHDFLKALKEEMNPSPAAPAQTNHPALIQRP